MIFLLIITGVLCISQIQNQLIPTAKAAGSCPSDSNDIPVDNQCLKGFNVKVFSYKAENECKLYYEITSDPCIVPTPTPSATSSATPTPTPSPLATPTPTPTPDITPTPSVTPTPTPIETATPTPVPSVIPGDINNDGKVNIFDFNLLVGDFQSQNLRSDLNKDGKVDLFDFNILVGDWTG